ncbi:NAD(P)-binding Rossmann-fold superfamily protein isoform 2 [Gossypium australe]|uniref:NAD(P)-binding Rossmann-fold superfamily protein isoform 2 n=1 Tax=Gossypium australe TaxID=47621 RepID=A0A5B6UTW4_9ROSI|nr:NAD(P)-binding Rossmann-fold superfamily protein isoform 2 [Gossypium australe]
MTPRSTWLFSWKGASGFSAYSTADDVTQGIDGTALTAIVTGASSVIGVETARVLALRGVHAVMAVRNLDAGRNVKEAILKEINGAKIDVMQLDLSSMASVRKFASEFQSSNLPLNILINNAGVMATPFMLSHGNIELQFATNHLGYSDCNLAVIYFPRFAYGQSKLANILHANELSRRLKVYNMINFSLMYDLCRL